ncbi:neprilysin-like [Armigeres subalbatus]|uniref:neprilysin-like n=1 Tax=Armigeres subalbatus TaxID=124917 RepID=UPI002ED47D9A
MATQRIWTTDVHGSDDHMSGKINSNNNGNANSASGDATANPYLVGVQSRFRRRYFHKSIFVALIVIIIILLIAIIVIACLLHFPPDVCHSPDCLRAASTLQQSMDLRVDPCEDFYAFSCGNWADDHPRPDSYTSYDWFSERQARILRNIRQYLQRNDSSDEPNPVKQARAMYRGCMNVTAMDALGYAPLFKLLGEYFLPNYPTVLNVTQVDYESYKFEWIRTLAKIKQMLGLDILIGFDVFPDPKNRDSNRLVLGTPELGSDLPFNIDILKHISKAKHKIIVYDDEDEEYADDPVDSKHMNAYKNFMIGAMKILVNNTNPNIEIESYADNFQKAADIYIKMSKAIMKMEKQAENASKSNNTEDRLNLQDTVYVTVVELQNMTDQYIFPKEPFPVWESYLNEVFEGIPEAHLDLNLDQILTSNADILYLRLLADYLSQTPLVHIELFIWWTVVEELILHTTTEIRKLHYEYYKAMIVTKGYTPRSLYCTGAVNKLMGMAVSYAITDHDFLKNTKPKVQQMLWYIRSAFERLVRDTNWMDWTTKSSTLEKSQAMRSLIGFPEWILEDGKLEQVYAPIDLSDTRHLQNMVQLIELRNVKYLRRWRLKNVLSWDTYPTNVNAFHAFQDNAITIPIAILQFPFYHLGLEALNYGAIGTVLGHELTHGFDDSGRQFDKNGNLKQWWTNNTVREYINRTACFVRQYSGYYVKEADDYIDGLQTLGENIADNGGVREAFEAYKIYQKHNGKEPLLPGFEDFTHEQLFFISYGNLWCESHTASSAKAALDDTHCPGWIRLKGVLSNSPEFSQTFGCKAGSGMNPTTEKCRIW